jgi:hypothetical protein
MNSRRDRETRLLAGVFHGEWTQGAPATFAHAAAALARRRCRLRVLALGSAGLAVATALALALFSAHANRAPLAPRTAKGYAIISDDQLLSELRDRPLLVVKKENGTREFVLLENE